MKYRRGLRRRKKVPLKIHTYKLPVPLTTQSWETIGDAGNTVEIHFNKSILSSASQALINNFNYYRISSVRFEYSPNFNMVGTYATTGGATQANIPPMQIVFDGNLDSSYNTQTAFDNSSRVILRSPWRKFKLYRKLTPTVNVSSVDASGTALTGVTTRLRRNNWFSTNDEPTIGRMFVREGLTPTLSTQTSGGVFNVKIYLYVKCYDFRSQ